MEIKKVMVVGCGQMGHGIAQVCAVGGAEKVYMNDVSEEFIQKGIDNIKSSLNVAVKKGKMTEADAKTIGAKLVPAKNYADAEDIDLVIEAATENIEVKKKIHTELDGIFPENVILASTTSALPITEIMNQTKHPERTIGTHFHHPPILMKLVEVVNGFSTSKETTESMMNFLIKVGKIPVPCKDLPGFVTSRVGIMMMAEGVNVFADGASSAENIDKACVAGFNWPMGPLALADLVGLDTMLMVLDDLVHKLGVRYQASPILRQLVSAGRLGVKTGKGFYDYTKK